MSKVTLGDKLLFPTLYICAEDLKGKDVHLTISRVVIDNLRTDRGTEPKPVIYFAELDKRADRPADAKRLVLNRTNSQTIASMHGTRAEDWTGKRITLFPTQCQAFGETVTCVRVRAKAP